MRLAVRQLDNLVDITLSSVPESEHANKENRAIGLGVMGFTDVTERLGLAYESEESYDLIDEIVEFVSFHAIDESADLARERGSYANFEGSGWSKGLVPFDTIDIAEADRGVPITVNRTMRQDWDALRAKVKGGIRNATLMAVAPTASIGLVAGTTPGFDPQFSQIFSRATSSGKFLEVNRNLVKDLQDLGLWEDVKDELLVGPGRPVARSRACPSTSRRSTRPRSSSPVRLHRGGGARPEVDRPGDQPEHLPRGPRRRQHDGPVRGRVGAGRQDDVLPPHEAAPHRRAVHGARQQDREDQLDRLGKRPWRGLVRTRQEGLRRLRRRQEEGLRCRDRHGRSAAPKLRRQRARPRHLERSGTGERLRARPRHGRRCDARGIGLVTAPAARDVRAGSKAFAPAPDREAGRFRRRRCPSR